MCKGTQHVPSYSFMKALVLHGCEVSSREFFDYHIIPWLHWLLSNSEASPRIWSCVTQALLHVRRVWPWD